MSTVKAANLQNTASGAPTIKNSSGTEIGQFVKAWVNFDGTGTVAIRDDFNVSSIADQGTGRYKVNLTNAMANTNFCAVVSTGSTFNLDAYVYSGDGTANMGTDFIRVTTRYSSEDNLHERDCTIVCAAMFEN